MKSYGRESSKIYQKKSYVILKVSNGFIVLNTKKGFDKGHTHISNYNMAKTLIDCSLNNKVPKTRNKYLLESLVRISTDKNYINMIKNLGDRDDRNTTRR